MERRRSLGKVLVPARIENLETSSGSAMADSTSRSASGRSVGCLDGHRSLRIADADAVRSNQLGLEPVRTGMPGRSPAKSRSRRIGRSALTIQGRDCVIDVPGIADHLPVIIGQLPLEAMDWVVE